VESVSGRCPAILALSVRPACTCAPVRLSRGEDALTHAHAHHRYGANRHRSAQCLSFRSPGGTVPPVVESAALRGRPSGVNVIPKEQPRPACPSVLLRSDRGIRHTPAEARRASLVADSSVGPSGPGSASAARRGLLQNDIRRQFPQTLTAPRAARPCRSGRSWWSCGRWAAAAPGAG